MCIKAGDVNTRTILLEKQGPSVSLIKCSGATFGSIKGNHITYMTYMITNNRLQI